MTWRRIAVPLGLAVVLVLPVLLGAVYIAPHAVFIYDESKSAQVTVGNNGETPEEITVDLLFGYPDTDSAGTAFIRFIDDPGPEIPSAADWIRAFPRRMQLQPGDQQTVRLLATPPADLPDGEYWARLMVTARGASIPVETADTTVRAGLQLEFRLVVAVTYRKGEVATGIALTNLEASADGDSLVVWVAVERQGTAAYLGTAEFDVVGGDGNHVAEWRIPLAVYYAMNRRFVFPIDEVPAGDYRLAFRLSTERDDLEEVNVLPAPAVHDTVAFTKP